MKRSIQCLPKALSPYAQALKHVALRGSVALGPSAKEMEIDMYRRGTLPADYRPPVHGKWDDTIERWAYAWQFPAEEEQDDIVGEVEKNAAGMQALLELGTRLLEHPPSAAVRSGELSGSMYPPPLLAGGGAHEFLETQTPNRPSTHSTSPFAEEEYQLLESEMSLLEESAPPQPVSSNESAGLQSSDPTNQHPIRSTLPPPAEKQMISAHTYSLETAIPAAYIDDGSEQAHASKELALVMEDHFGLEYTEEGLIAILSALCRADHWQVARCLFNFIVQVGLGPTAELYKALMKHASRTGDPNASMALIEEMKSCGITPRIGNWHELMRAFHKAKDYGAVSQIVDNMKMYANIEPNEVTFALQLRALAKDQSQMNALPEALQLFDQMENVYGFIASRPHYHALLFHLSQSPQAEMRRRCEELAKKMEILGIVWNADTYLYLIRSAQVVGDVKSVEKLFAKMRNNNVPVSMAHLTWAIQAQVQHIIRIDYAALKENGKAEEILPDILNSYTTAFGIYDMVMQRGWIVEIPFINAMLRLTCQGVMLAMEHIPDNTDAIGRFEEQAFKIWNETFGEWRLEKDAYSYECYIALLAYQQRIDEAEKLFQSMVLREDMTPTRRCYECLVFMHLSSGEEGGTARALRYLEAMENAGISIRPSLLKKIVRVNNAAGYMRDMKRRARRIMQAREEYMARKAEATDMEFAADSGATTPATSCSPPTHDEDGSPLLAPLPIPPTSTLAWWEKWKAESISKHELFTDEKEDGTPRGESFEEKNDALKQMGISTHFPTKSSVPDPSRSSLVAKIRAEEGEVAGSLWALDGGELSYPKDGGGPQGWGVRLWRERQLLKKEQQKSLDGLAPPAEFSALGTGARVAGDQVDIERSGATNPGELADYRQFGTHVYDDDTPKPASELSPRVSPLEELVWHREARDSLQPYKTDAELAMESDNTFYAQMNEDSAGKMNAVVEAIKNKEEGYLAVVGHGATRRSKHDYLEKWREMYRHGTLEVPDGPLLQFGRTPHDHTESMAAMVRGWYGRNKKTLATNEQLDRWETEAQRDREADESRKNLRKQKRLRRATRKSNSH